MPSTFPFLLSVPVGHPKNFFRNKNSLTIRMMCLYKQPFVGSIEPGVLSFDTVLSEIAKLLIMTSGTNTYDDPYILFVI